MTRRTTAAEFDAARLVKTHKIQDDQIAAARRFIVGGESFGVIADDYGWFRQNVDHAVTKLWRAVLDFRLAKQAEKDHRHALPDGWLTVTVIAPIQLISDLRTSANNGTDRRVTGAEFAAACMLLGKFSENRTEAARRFMVNGETLLAIGNDYQWTRQAVDRAVCRVWKAVTDYRAACEAEARALRPDLPEGWTVTTISIPFEPLADLLENVRVLAEQGQPASVVKA